MIGYFNHYTLSLNHKGAREKEYFEGEGRDEKEYGQERKDWRIKMGRRMGMIDSKWEGEWEERKNLERRGIMIERRRKGELGERNNTGG